MAGDLTAAAAADFFNRPATEVAPEVLGLVLRVDPPPTVPPHQVPSAPTCVGRIVEVEAYCGEGDQASHSAKGPNRRNATMFGPPGHMYVYLTYGVHWCSNLVCGPEGTGDAVLLRALAPLEGFDAMFDRRTGGGTVQHKRPLSQRDLCSGPAKLTQACAVTGADDASPVPLRLNATSSSPAAANNNASVPSRFSLVDDGFRAGLAAADVTVSRRVGISLSVDFPWRWYLTGDPNVSRR